MSKSYLNVKFHCVSFLLNLIPNWKLEYLVIKFKL